MKDKIIDASIELFNDVGSHRITTNHIIDRLGISPGTFYYHFKNKEEIIRRVFLKITEDFDSLYKEKSDDFGIHELIESMKENFRLYYKYRFFYNDLSMLLDRDEELERMYRENYRKRIERIRTIINIFEEKGMLKEFSSAEHRESLIKTIWIINDYWLTFNRVIGDSVENAVKSGVVNYLHLIEPWLSEEALTGTTELI